MLKLVNKEDELETRIQYRYIEEEATARYVLIDKDENIIDLHPSEEEIDSYESRNLERYPNLDMMPIRSSFPGMKYHHESGLYTIRGHLRGEGVYSDHISMWVEDDNNPFLQHPDGCRIGELYKYIVIGNIGDKELCHGADIIVYGLPNKEKTAVYSNLHGSRDYNWYWFNAKKIVTLQKRLTIRGKDHVIDKCICEEIVHLNEKCGIETESCCCGHGTFSGYIEIIEKDKEKMLVLGYKHTDYNSELFVPKGICNCKG